MLLHSWSIATTFHLHYYYIPFNITNTFLLILLLHSLSIATTFHLHYYYISLIFCFFYSASSTWDCLWIGLSRRDAANPSDAYFMWAAGGYLDTTNLYGLYPFASVNPDMDGTEPCVVMFFYPHTNSQYHLGDLSCNGYCRFICEMI